MAIKDNQLISKVALKQSGILSIENSGAALKI